MEQPLIDSTLVEIRQALEAGRVEEAIASLIRLRPADRAEAFADLPDDDQAALLPRLDISFTADLFEELEADEAVDAAESLSHGRLADVWTRWNRTKPPISSATSPLTEPPPPWPKWKTPRK